MNDSPLIFPSAASTFTTRDSRMRPGIARQWPNSRRPTIIIISKQEPLFDFYWIHHMHYIFLSMNIHSACRIILRLHRCLKLLETNHVWALHCLGSVGQTQNCSMPSIGHFLEGTVTKCLAGITCRCRGSCMDNESAQC